MISCLLLTANISNAKIDTQLETFSIDALGNALGNEAAQPSAAYALVPGHSPALAPVLVQGIVCPAATLKVAATQ